jgi:hypothetical protein
MPRSRDDTYMVALHKAVRDLQQLEPLRVAYLAGCVFAAAPPCLQKGRTHDTLFC